MNRAVGLAILTTILTAMLMITSIARSEESPQKRMTRERYAEYVRLFNAHDDRYAGFYHPNVVFDHGPVYGVLRGRQAIVDFYHEFAKSIDEEIVPGRIAIDNDNGIMMVELATRLRAKRDGVQLASRLLEHKGDLFVTRDVIVYGIADGLITSIVGADEGTSFEPADPAARVKRNSEQRAPFPAVTAPLTPQLQVELEKRFREYIDCFNRQQYACFGNFYAEDVVYTSPRWQLRNRRQFIDFYAKAWQHFTEHLTIEAVEIEPDRIVARLSNRIEVFADFPEFPARPLKKGDSYSVAGEVVYTLRDGRFVLIDDD